MHCPNCRHILTIVQLENVEVEHCNNCGGTIFEANEINRITQRDAERLAMMKKTDEVSASDKISPRDGSVMTRVKSNSIPEHVTLLQSKSSGEIFAYADDLVAFKQAQDAKVNYYKIWHLPMPAVQQVLVFGFAIFAAVSLAALVTLIQDPTTQSTQAQSLCENGIQTIELEDGHLVSCTTQLDLKCELTARCSNSSELIPLTCNDRTYFGTVPATCEEIRFMYTEDNQVIETDWFDLRK